MKTHAMGLLGVVAALSIHGAWHLHAEGAPEIIWEQVTPNGLANSIQGVGWSPGPGGRVAFGSTDRWMRTREPDTGALVYSVLQPIRSGSVNQTIYSTDGQFLAVHNSGGGLGYRVYRAADGLFLGTLSVTVDGAGLVHFAPDSQLLGAVGGDGTLSRWSVQDFTVVFTVGGGYHVTNTTFNFSPDGKLQSAATLGAITIRQRADGATVRLIAGGAPKGITPVSFTPDSSGIAAWASSPNRATLWRISDGAVLMTFPGSVTNESVGALRFTPDGAHLITTGYLPFVDADGLWQQKGMIRFWRVADGSLRQYYDTRTGIAVTSPVALSSDFTRFAYGTYEGTAVAARIPSGILTNRITVSSAPSRIELLPDGTARVRQPGAPGAEYHLEVTTNLLTWREVGVATANGNGYCEFLDTNANGSRLKFYRSWRAP